MRKRTFSRVPWHKRICVTTMSVVMVSAFAPGVGVAVAEEGATQAATSIEQTSQQTIDLSSCNVTTGPSTWYFTDEAVEPTVTVYYYDDEDERVIVDPDSYTVTYQKYDEESGGWADVTAADLKTEGQYQITVTGKADKGYTGSNSSGWFYLRDARNLSNAWMNTTYRYAYDGKAVEPDVTVQYWDQQQGETITIDPANYTVSYEKATGTDEWGNSVYTAVDKSQLVDIGEYHVVATGKASAGYSGTATGYFEIVSAKNLEYASIDLKRGRYFYTGEKLDLGITVADAAGEEVSPENYALSYEKYDEESESWTNVAESDLTTTGRYRVTATGVEANGYSGSTSDTFRIVDARELSNDRLSLDDDRYVYSGESIQPEVTVYYRDNESNRVSIDPANYTLSYERETGEDEEGNTTYTSVAASQLTVPGDYRVTATANAGSGYTGSISDTFTIVDAKDLDYGSVSTGFRYLYTGKAVSPEVTVTDAAGNTVDAANYKLVFEKESGTDEEGDATYSEVSASQVLDAGSYRVKATATGGGYSGSSGYDDFTIAKREGLGSLRLSESTFDYTGEVVKPKVTVTDLIGEKVDASNYELSYETYDRKKGTEVSVTASELVEAGSYEVIATAKDGSSVSTWFEIVDRKNLGNARASVDDSSTIYTGKAVSPKIKVYYDDQDDDRVAIGSDVYTLSYKKRNDSTYSYTSVDAKDLVGAGHYQVTATAKDGSGYTGSVSTEFEIVKNTDLDYASMKLKYSRVSNGEAVTPKVTVKDASGNKVDAANYELKYQRYDDGEDEWVSVAASDIVGTGEYSVTATAKDGSGYTGSVSRSFWIYNAKDLGTGEIELDEYSYAQTGSAITPEVTVSSCRGGIVNPANYELRYAKYDEGTDKYVAIDASKVVEAGHYQVTATAKDGSGYSGSVSESFNIVASSKDVHGYLEYMSLDSSRIAYTGGAVVPEVTVYDPEGEGLVDPSTYTLGYEKLVGWKYEYGSEDGDGIYEKIDASDLVDVGIYRVTATAKDGSGYGGSTSQTFHITKSTDDIEINHIGWNDDDYDFEYTGQVITPDFTVYDANDKAVDPSNYTLVYSKYDSDEGGYTRISASDIVGVGEYRVKAVAKDGTGYIGSTADWFGISARNTFSKKYYLSVDYYQAYTGKTITPKVEVRDKDTDEVLDASKYVLSYEAPSGSDWEEWVPATADELVEVGDYRVTATAMDDSGYTGTIDSEFQIVAPNDLEAATISTASTKEFGEEPAFLYTGKAIAVNPTLTSIDGKTVDASNYVLSYAKWDENKDKYVKVKADSLIESGYYRLRATAKDESGYEGTAEMHFYIADSKDLAYASYSLNGSSVTITDFEGNVVDPSNYTLALKKYDSSKEEYAAVELSELANPGRYTLTVTAKDGAAYTGENTWWFEVKEGGSTGGQTGGDSGNTTGGNTGGNADNGGNTGGSTDNGVSGNTGTDNGDSTSGTTGTDNGSTGGTTGGDSGNAATDNTGGSTSADNDSGNTSASSGLSKGETAKVKASSKVTLAVKATGSSTVTVTKVTAKSGASVTVNTVKINGKTYKVTAIAKNAFKGTKAKKITVGANVKTIGAGAFSGSKTLKSLTIGKNVKSIGKNAFKGSKKLKTLTVKSTKLTKKGIKSALKGSSIKTVKVKVSSKKKTNKKYVKKYKKIFTKKICGKKVTVK